MQKKGRCIFIDCEDCAYTEVCRRGSNTLYHRLCQIGAMAILRMFPEKKKPILDAGTKIKFSDGSIATILLERGILPILVFIDDKGREYEHMEYLVGRIWEIVE